MRCGIICWLMGSLATILALVVSSPVVQGGYTPPTRSGSLIDEVSEFVDDFTPWNASLNNRPVQFLESAPAADQGMIALGLFWFWLQDLGTGSTGNASQSSPLNSSGLAGLSFPSLSGDPVHSPIGAIVMGQLGNDLPSLLSNGGSSSLLSDPPPSPGGNSGLQPGNSPPVLGSNGGSDPPSPAAATPVPSTFSLLAVGLAGLLLELRMRRKRIAC